MNRISKVGYFHFGTAHHDPIGTLATCLDDAQKRLGTLTDSLIVLPEGFNLRQDYWDKFRRKGTGASDTAIIGELNAVSSAYGCAFVAGLIVNDVPDVDPPFNSAYLIDQGHGRLLSRKHADDTSTNYTPHPSYFEHPFIWRTIGITALMCMDSYQDTERFAALSTKLDGCAVRVVCIPMNMTNGLLMGNPGQKLTARYGLSDAVWVAANSHDGWVHSFASSRAGVIQNPACRGPVAKVEIFSLTDLA